jgi:putative transcriptional regulator
MSTNPRCHPTTDIMNEYIQGNLSTGWSVAISAHLELCQSCKHKFSELELNFVSSWMQDSSGNGTQDFSHLIANIVDQPQLDSIDSAVLRQSPIGEIHMLDHSFTLPPILAKAANEGLVWKKLAGGINQAKLDIDTETQCEFIYMSPGSQTPMHKHQGNEITLVLDGSFSDEAGIYEAADFIVRSGKEEHQPVSEEGCLCFAVLDSPLTFTRGLARLFNPINRYRFRKTIAQQS